MTESSVRRLATEMVVIVGSILLAFALDAWWDEAQERERVDVLLDAVALEFEAEIAGLDSIIAANVEFGTFLTAVVERADPALPTISRDSLMRWAEEQSDFQIYDPAFGSLTALISTGGLERIEDPVLQRRLAGWSAELDDLTWERDQAYDAVDAMIEGYSATGRFLELGGRAQYGPLLAQGIVEDPDLRLRMARVANAYSYYTRDLERIRERAADLANAIRSRAR